MIEKFCKLYETDSGIVFGMEKGNLKKILKAFIKFQEKEFTIKDKIIFELHKLLSYFGAKSDVLCITGSYKDTLENELILKMLVDYNKENN